MKKLYISIDFIPYKIYYNTCEGDGMANLKPHQGTQKPRAFAQPWATYRKGKAMTITISIASPYFLIIIIAGIIAVVNNNKKN